MNIKVLPVEEVQKVPNNLDTGKIHINNRRNFFVVVKVNALRNLSVLIGIGEKIVFWNLADTRIYLKGESTRIEVSEN